MLNSKSNFQNHMQEPPLITTSYACGLCMMLLLQVLLQNDSVAWRRGVLVSPPVSTAPCVRLGAV
jgi:hypothetical protein